jgi:Dihaem cytochrome c
MIRLQGKPQMFDRMRTTKIRWSLLVLFVIGLWSIGLGWGIAFAFDKSVDSVSSRFQTGKELYIENCSGCHIAIPPEVLPTEAWKQLLEKPEDHYGQGLTNVIRISQLLIWDYLNAYSRPVTPNEAVPLYVGQSRYFKALHPKVKFPEPVTHKTCIACHPGAADFNFRSLTSEWEDAP